MTSQRLSIVSPTTICFWLILFMCLAVAASFKCYECYDEKDCAKGGNLTDCNSTTYAFLLRGPDNKWACVKSTKDEKVESKGCAVLPKAATGECYEGKGPNKEYNKKVDSVFCVCLSDSCNTGTILKPWSNQMWIGLGLVCFFIIMLR